MGTKVSGMNTSAALRELVPKHLGGRRHASKTTQTVMRASPSAAKKWLAGRAIPTGEHLVLLLAHCEEAAAEFEAIVAQVRATIK